MPTYVVTIGKEQIAVSIDGGRGVVLNGEQQGADIQPVGESAYSVLLAGHSTHVVVRREGGTYQVLINSHQQEVIVESERDRLLKSSTRTAITHGAAYEIHAPMPAMVVKVEVNVGDLVDAGTGLLILEAMKMENEIRAHQSAKVKSIHVLRGNTVEKGQLMMVLE